MLQKKIHTSNQANGYFWGKTQENLIKEIIIKGTHLSGKLFCFVFNYTKTYGNQILQISCFLKPGGDICLFIVLLSFSLCVYEISW